MVLPDGSGMNGWVRVRKPSREIMVEEEGEKWEVLAADVGEEWTVL